MDLVASVLAKDRKATAEFVGRYSDALYGYLASRLAPRSDLVEDVLQEVFLAAWRGLGSFRGAASLSTWLMGIARHKVEDVYRARVHEPEPLDAEAADYDTGPLEIDETIDRERLRERTRSILEQLPSPYATALLWRYWEKRSAREIAMASGKTEKAVERLLARAREQFRRKWLEANV